MNIEDIAFWSLGLPIIIFMNAAAIAGSIVVIKAALWG